MIGSGLCGKQENLLKKVERQLIKESNLTPQEEKLRLQQVNQQNQNNSKNAMQIYTNIDIDKSVKS